MSLCICGSVSVCICLCLCPALLVLLLLRVCLSAAALLGDFCVFLPLVLNAVFLQVLAHHCPLLTDLDLDCAYGLSDLSLAYLSGGYRLPSHIDAVFELAVVCGVRFCAFLRLFCAFSAADVLACAA